jgi:hypothetical protein
MIQSSGPQCCSVHFSHRVIISFSCIHHRSFLSKQPAHQQRLAVHGQFNSNSTPGRSSVCAARKTVDTEYLQTSRRLGDVFLRYRGKDGAVPAVPQLAQSGTGTFAPSADGKTYTATFEFMRRQLKLDLRQLDHADADPELRMQYTIEERAVV